MDTPHSSLRAFGAVACGYWTAPGYRGVAWLLQNGKNPALEAAVVKDLGALVEQEIPDIVRSLVEIEPGSERTAELARTLHYTVLAAPSFSLRGGTREILRGIIARGLGLR